MRYLICSITVQWQIFTNSPPNKRGDNYPLSLGQEYSQTPVKFWSPLGSPEDRTLSGIKHYKDFGRLTRLRVASRSLRYDMKASWRLVSSSTIVRDDGIHPCSSRESISNFHAAKLQQLVSCIGDTSWSCLSFHDRKQPDRRSVNQKWWVIERNWYRLVTPYGIGSITCKSSQVTLWLLRPYKHSRFTFETWPGSHFFCTRLDISKL